MADLMTTSPETGADRPVITHALAGLAREIPDRTLIHWVDTNVSTTYGDLDRAARSWAGLLAARGIEAGDHIAVQSSRGLDFLGALLGGMYLGAIVAPLGVELRGESLRHPLRLYQPKILIVDADLAELALSAAAATRVASVLSLPTDELNAPAPAGYASAAGNRAEWPVAAELATPCLIMSTSGTTGPSKGSLWDHGTMSAWAGNYVRQMRYEPDDRIYCCTPLTHANALVSGVMTAILAQCSVVIANRFSVTNFWAHVHEYGATTANVLGSMILLLLKDPRADPDYIRTSHLRTMLASSCSADAYRQIKQTWGIIPVCAYGLTDFGTLTSSTYGEDCPAGSCGQALP